MSQVEAHEALASKTRMDILSCLYKRDMDVRELAKETGLQPITLRHHLKALRTAGFIEEVPSRQANVGRPRSVYRIARSRPVLTFPSREYLQLADILVRSLQIFMGDSMVKKILKWVGKKMGQDTAKHLVGQSGIEKWTSESYSEYIVNKYFREAGAEPEVVSVNAKEVVFRLHNCPFHELAQRRPDLICDTLHAGFHEALCEGIGMSVRITNPKCMGHGHPYCEQVCLFGE